MFGSGLVVIGCVVIVSIKNKSIRKKQSAQRIDGVGYTWKSVHALLRGRVALPVIVAVSPPTENIQ